MSKTNDESDYQAKNKQKKGSQIELHQTNNCHLAMEVILN